MKIMVFQNFHSVKKRLYECLQSKARKPMHQESANCHSSAPSFTGRYFFQFTSILIFSIY